MSFHRAKSIYLWLVLLGALSFLAVYAYMNIHPPEVKEPAPAIEVSAPAAIRPEFRVAVEEKYALCRKYSLQCSYVTILTGKAREELNDLTPADMQEKFPQSAGWNVRWETNRVILEQSLPGLCPEHKKRWHLACDEKTETVKVYLGPAAVGTDSELVKTTEIRPDSLPVNIREQIMRGSLEFFDWEELVATLDSLAEYE